MANIDLRHLADRIQNIPTLPAVVSELLRTVHDPGSDASAVEKILKQDQSLSMKVLKLVNSAFYGYAGRIKTLHQAVVILGFNAVKSLAMTATAFQAFGGKGRSGFNREEFWKHSVATAVAARMIATESGVADPEEAFMSGIIHDVGKVLMDEHAGEAFDEILAHVRKYDSLFYDAEKAVLGTPHTQVGRWIAGRWNFPGSLIDPIFYHHNPTLAGKAPGLAAAIHVADILARRLKLGNGGDNRVPELDAGALEVLRMTTEDVVEIESRVAGEFAKADLFVRMVRDG